VLNFRTPIDYASNGQTIFKDTASQLNKNFVKLDQFSGVFRVSELENIFENGVFRQELQLQRVANQEIPEEKGKSTGSFLKDNIPSIDNTGDYQ
jgi:hypothetical protein